MLADPSHFVQAILSLDILLTVSLLTETREEIGISLQFNFVEPPPSHYSRVHALSFPQSQLGEGVARLAEGSLPLTFGPGWVDSFVRVCLMGIEIIQIRVNMTQNTQSFSLAPSTPRSKYMGHIRTIYMHKWL